MMEFLAMNGHGLYVWSAYTLSAATLAGLGAAPFVRMRQRLRLLRRQQELES